MNSLIKIDNFVLSDFLDLVHPEAVEEARNRIIGALQSYEMSKSFLIQQTILEHISILKKCLSPFSLTGDQTLAAGSEIRHFTT